MQNTQTSNPDGGGALGSAPSGPLDQVPGAQSESPSPSFTAPTAPASSASLPFRRSPEGTQHQRTYTNIRLMLTQQTQCGLAYVRVTVLITLVRNDYGCCNTPLSPWELKAKTLQLYS